ncbi:16603_t:CDS:1 [Racocetra persica]|uniref:16603_t:CDS:1 n=1 Tax=Racocetra persica TaxID=160502 RepID=A0ACA9PP38_9GLOM|nr:16603_t:CDS:1 [Racocetra persica]
MSGISLNEFNLRSAIERYNKKDKANARSSYLTFKELTNSTYANSNEESKVKIFGQAMLYLALCNIHEFGVEQNEKTDPLSIAKYLHDKKRYEDAWRIYSERAKDDEVKLKALSNIADYYILGHVRRDDVLGFKIAFEFYSKKEYKETFEIFSILTFSQDSEIKFLATCLMASCYLFGHNVRKDKDEAFKLINKYF